MLYSAADHSSCDFFCCMALVEIDAKHSCYRSGAPYRSIMMALQKAVLVFVAILSAASPAASSRATTYDFDDSSGLGRMFDGIGGLSGGGATSKLLVNYPEKQRNEILDYLFKPNFGASLQILKVEIGGDAQSTDGTEASHMHNSWDENYQRGYEWWLMVEAKKRNPNIKLYGLPWGFPGWIGLGTRSPFVKPEMTADYIIRWVNGAKVHYNLTIDYVGIWNERPYDITYIKVLRQMLDKTGHSHVRIVAADKKWVIAEDILADPALAKAVDFVGCHYPGTLSTKDALDTGKPLWASEDYSTFNDEQGGGCWARILNKNYAVGNITATISWNLIASYYQHLPYFRDGLMTAVEPWGGNYVVETPIWFTAHTTQFTEVGWTYLRHGAGAGLLARGGSYVSLVSPDGKDFTIVIETMSHDHSRCIRPALPKYDVEPQKMRIKLGGSFGNIPQMNRWYSKLGFKTQPTIMFQSQEPLKFKNGMASLDLGLDEVYTLTTLTRGHKGQYAAPPPSKPFPLPYQDDFENYTAFAEPYNLAQQIGSFEVIQTSDPKHGQVLRQMVLTDPLEWCPISLVFPITLGGDGNWTDLYVEVETSVGTVNNTDGVFVAARVQKLGCQVFAAKGLFFYVFPKTLKYIVAYDLARTQVLTEGTLTSQVSTWNKLSILVQGSQVQGAVNGNNVFNMTAPEAQKSGFAGIGTDSYGLADFDNFKITTAAEGAAIMRNNNPVPPQQKDTLYFEPERH